MLSCCVSLRSTWRRGNGVEALGREIGIDYLSEVENLRTGGFWKDEYRDAEKNLEIRLMTVIGNKMLAPFMLNGCNERLLSQLRIEARAYRVAYVKIIVPALRWWV